MTKRTLPRLAGAGWAHPYGHAPFSPFLYADGGDGGDSGSNDGGGTDDGADDGGQDDDAGGTGDDTQDDTGKDDKPKPKPPAKKDDGEDPAATVARLQKELKQANADAAKARTNAKKQAADEARTEIVQELGKALGLIKDEETPPDPAALKAQIEKATAAHRETAVELAVYRGASKYGADPDALTDSRAFLKSIAGLDPSDEEFAKKVQAAIKKAVDDNPKLKAAPAAPPRASGDFSGSTEKPKNQNSIEAQREAFRKGRR